METKGHLTRGNPDAGVRALIVRLRRVLRHPEWRQVSRRAVAKAIGVSDRTVRRWLSEEEWPDPRTQKRLRDWLDKRLRALITQGTAAQPRTGPQSGVGDTGDETMTGDFQDRANRDGLVLPVGTRIRFHTDYGLDAGTYEGEIVARMVATPNGFISGFAGHYEVKTYLPHDHTTRNLIVVPSMIQHVLTDTSDAE